MPFEKHVLLLSCGNCGSRLGGLQSDTIFLCANCGRCWVSDEGLSEVESVVFRDASDDAINLPFWEIKANVHIRERITRMESCSSPQEGPRFFAPHSERGLQSTWRDIEGKSILLPAFSSSRTLSTGVSLDRNPPVLAEVDDMEFPSVIGGATTIADAIELARGVAVGIEVAADDFLAMVDIDFTPFGCRLIALPCHPRDSSLMIADTGVRVPCSSIEDWADICRWHGITS
jgi:hypothetical protein